MIRALPQRLGLGLATFLVAGLALLSAEEPPKEGKARRQKGERAKQAERAKAKPEEVVKASLPTQLTDHMPVGRVFRRVVIPSYTHDKLKSVMTADSITRIDEQYLDLLQLVIFVHNAEGQAETTVSMDEAVYDLQSGELRSKTPSTIEQPRFTMTGETMIFDTDTQVARLVGDVRLVVPDAGQMAPNLAFPGTRTEKTEGP